MNKAEQKESTESISFKKNLNQELDRLERESSKTSLRELWNNFGSPLLITFLTLFTILIFSIIFSKGPEEEENKSEENFEKHSEETGDKDDRSSHSEERSENGKSPSGKSDKSSTEENHQSELEQEDDSESDEEATPKVRQMSSSFENIEEKKSPFGEEDFSQIASSSPVMSNKGESDPTPPNSRGNDKNNGSSPLKYFPSHR